MKQISVVSHENQDITASLAEALAGAGINIETLDIEHVDETFVVTLTVDRYDEALQVLQEAGFEAVSEDALLVRLPDEPGGLAKIARRFREADVHVRSLRLVRRGNGHAIVAISVDRTQKACELVRDVLITEEAMPGE
jgi:hypothetical protein